MAKHEAAWWAERVAELTAGGDASVIARRYAVTVQLLKWWRWKLGGGRRKKSVRTIAPARPRRASSDQRLLPVVIDGLPDRSGVSVDDGDHAASTIIETTRGRISIRGTLSPRQLAAVVAELVGGC